MIYEPPPIPCRGLVAAIVLCLLFWGILVWILT